MTEVQDQTFLTSLPDEKQLESFILTDETDDNGLNVESLNDFECKSILNDESEDFINKTESPEIPPTSIQNIENTDVQDEILPDNPPAPPVQENLQPTFPRSVYDYAAMVYGKSEDPHQNKLDNDINAILGSSDPPAGFGFLHPKVYYLTQQRPIPLEPLKVWRGYNGHVYFVPIKVQQLETARIISPTKSRKSTATRTIPSSKRKPQRSQTVSTEHRSRKSSIYKSSTSKERTSANRSLSSHKGYAQTISSANELTNNTRTTFSEEEENQLENKDQQPKMWRSVITCMPAPKKPISKRSQHALEDMRAIKQQQVLQDPIGSNRPVLPNIRLIPKTKFLYKGLAYKEVRKIAGVMNENDDENNLNSLKRPLVDYNRTQAYVRHEVNAARTRQKHRPPSSTVESSSNELLTRSQTVLDIRETRKRIIKGTTVAHHPASKRPGRTENKSLPNSEVLLPVRTFNTLSNIPTSSSIVRTSPRQNKAVEYTSPMVSQNFDVSSTDNVLALPSTDHRPPTSKSSILSQQITASDVSVLTKYVNRPRSTSRRTPTTELIADAS